MLALPVSADAKPGYKVRPGGFELILPVENVGARYVVGISANNKHRVQFTVERPALTTEYATKGRVSSRRIEADFGALGRVDVRLHFVRYGPGFFRRPHCKGRDPLEAIGTYRGTIEFSHKGSVADVSVKSGRVFLERSYRQVCKRRRPKPEPGLFPKLRRKTEEGLLAVSGKEEGRTVYLEAEIFASRRDPARSAGHVYAAASERYEGMRITRSIGGLFDWDTFVMSKRDKMPETIEVELPMPFSGHALYSRSPGSPASWTGDLSVDLPGADVVPLTGPGFSAALCRGRVDSCTYGSDSDYKSLP